MTKNIKLAKQVRSRLLGRTSSDFYGVCFSPKAEQWVTSFYIENVRVHLGSYDTEEHAAYAYNVAFKNFVEGQYLIHNMVRVSKKVKKNIRERVFLILGQRGYHIREESKFHKKFDKLMDRYDIHLFNN